MIKTSKSTALTGSKGCGKKTHYFHGSLGKKIYWKCGEGESESCGNFFCIKCEKLSYKIGKLEEGK